MSEWQTKAYAISDDYLKVFSVGEANPPKGWRPDLTQGLDAALPMPWPEEYVKRGRQPFNPWAFYRNVSALCAHWKKTNNVETRNILILLHKRLLEYSELRDGRRLLLYRFTKDYREQYRVNVPWTSAYASGAALIGLTSMYKCADMPEALVTAKEVLADLANPIDPRGNRPDLWVSFTDEAGYLWFEEKPLDQVEQPRILNGHIRALTGIYTYWVHTKDETALPLLRAGIKTVEDHAPRYRKRGGINAYDLLRPYLADYGPERTIVQQDILFKMTGDPIFAEYRNMFEADMHDEIEQIKKNTKNRQD
ncbi:hypothetical protein AA309_15155 [Microvirga vignae]|uniref:D-glucuronyl C5-epimerase C-terminal domain-containing protein n=1 Tax=Microvirga vignae TaxID=1225564 RepID=A0A0H1RAX9_9HYPH|nr:D-glucuronyl C5-epimerase family protein [Microvirga vignae]KLK92318.1 hypothetical protein AA309_15155 [Microvirga vignae]